MYIRFTPILPAAITSVVADVWLVRYFSVKFCPIESFVAVVAVDAVRLSPLVSVRILYVVS